ncbi:MAG TPA: hypothetical protein VFC78_20535, partial [Tepidisphaeraceae bacterium]|nr:hypothetical protein [Tepidisphaeraceae bacterium]
MGSDDGCTGLAVKKSQALLRQARSDLTVFDLLAAHEDVPECHALHFLQMATEKLAKAAFLALGVPFDAFSHVAFSHLPRLLSRRDVAGALGHRTFLSYRTFLRRTAPLFRMIDELNPSVGLQTSGSAKDGPNVEYPWEGRDPTGEPGQSHLRSSAYVRYRPRGGECMLVSSSRSFAAKIELSPTKGACAWT